MIVRLQHGTFTLKLLENLIENKTKQIGRAIDTVNNFAATIGSNECLEGLSSAEVCDRLIERGRKRQWIVEIGIPRLQERRDHLSRAREELGTLIGPRVTQTSAQSEAAERQIFFNLAQRFPSLRHHEPQKPVKPDAPINVIFPVELRSALCRKILTSGRNFPPDLHKAMQDLAEDDTPVQIRKADPDQALRKTLVRLWKMDGLSQAALLTGNNQATDMFITWVTMIDIAKKKALLQFLNPPTNTINSPAINSSNGHHDVDFSPAKRGRPTKQTVAQRKAEEQANGMDPVSFVLMDAEANINYALGRIKVHPGGNLSVSEVCRMFQIRLQSLEKLIEQGLVSHRSKPGEVPVFSPTDAVTAYTVYSMEIKSEGVNGEPAYRNYKGILRDRIQQRMAEVIGQQDHKLAHTNGTITPNRRI